MNKWAKKATAVGLCAAFCLSGAAVAFAKTDSKQETKEEQTEKNEDKKEEKSTSSKSTQQDLYKDETVYVLAGADGSVQKLIVSDWLQNGQGSRTISDKSDLTNIENVKGDESYTINGDNMKVWDAQGNDIYYQGNTTKELPVDMSVTYKLNGKTVSAEEIAGKSGKVTIRFDYENRQYENVEIDGKEEKMYVPFAMLTGMMLDTDSFSNVEVSNGKYINDGDRTIVVGMAFPGLQENFELNREKIEIPDYVEITADVKDFSFGMTVTVASNEVFNKVDYENIDSPEDLKDSFGELTDAVSQLMDGSSALYDGLCTLLEKSDELVEGVNQLAEGAKAIKDGADSLDDGATQLKAGLEELSSGLNTLSANSSSLNSGAEQVFNTLLATVSTQIEAAGISIPALTIGNYAEVLNGVINSLDETAVYDQALAKVTAAVEENRSLITEKVTEAVQEAVETQVKAAVQEQVTTAVTASVKEQVTAQVIQGAVGLDKATYDAAVNNGQISSEQQAAVETAIAEQMASESVQATIAANVTAQMESDEIKSTITANTEAQMVSESIQATIAQNTETKVQQTISENMASEEVQAQLTVASEGAKKIISLKTSLDSYNAFYLGLRSYTDGVDSAAAGAVKLNSGAATLKDGTVQLKGGAATLYNGVLTMKDGTPALTEGVTKLRDGSMQLSDGMKQFAEQGIQKLVEFVDGDLEGFVARLKATVDVSKEYNNFSGISEDMDGKVKFIYRTEEIKANN